ncbi:unnamed protein product [Acanthoscelides obtectus]|uniref:Uncharacterized protein n=1 Tax=Acanthoscelides obtectus TaxID=200917 RepID=A0A9P0MDN0_ACAOB|nr:unnamed protein product [Acanthoscelides obtectus]CAK1682223.1 hypothetical protein AOBTE_LOCUS33496 [Acanthoscelides obtectus]
MQDLQHTQGVRLHEQRAHPEPENDNRRRELRRPDSEIYDILATIETQTHKGPFMAKMVAESGLTKDQIRHRRDKPIYKQYLDAARKKQLIPSPSVPCEPPTCLTSEKNDHQAVTSTPPTARDDVKEGECSAAVASTLSPLSPDPTTSRRRIRQESMSPLSQPTVRRPRTEAVNLTANSPAQVEQTQVVIEPALREYLASEREAALANGNGHLADLCQAGSSLAINDLASYLDNWILELFQKGGRKYNSNGYRGGQKPKNYGGTRPGRGPRVESYKKAQDLYLRNRTALVDKIISGIPLDSTEEVPPLKAVEELSTRLHDRKAHPVEYAKEAADLRDPVPETETFQIMAGIEAQNPAGHINKRMAEVTSLTIDQIRGKRRKPDYQKYLELAKRKLQAPGSRNPHDRWIHQLLPQVAALPRVATKRPCCPRRQEAAAKQKRPRESYSPRELNPAKRKSQPAKSRQNKQRNECNPDGTDPTSAPSEMRKRKRVASPSGSGIQTTSKEPGSAVNSPNDRPATDSSPSNTLKSHRDTLNDGPGTSYSHAVAESSPCAHGAVLPQKSPNPPAPLVNLNSTFVEYLREGRGVFTEAGHRDIRRLIDMAIFGSPEQLAVALDRRVESKLNKKAPINRVQRRNQQPDRHYNQPKGSSGKRASEYKKAQDLFARDRSGLADIVFGGRSMYEPPKLPTILEVETLFAGIWESPAGTDDEAISDPKAATSEVFLLHLS